MARSRFKNRSGRLGLLGVLLIAVCALFVASAAGNLPGSGFDAFDGNLVVNDEAKDWANVGIDCVAPGISGCSLDKPTGQQDDSFGQGTKEDTPAPTIVSGSIPNNKSDLTRFYISNERANGDQFLYLAWERVQEPNGTTNMDFEFNKRQCTPNTNDPDCSANGVTPIRTAGDVLVKYDLSQGGVNPDLGFHRWVTTGNPATVCEANNSVPCWGPVQSLAGNFEGAINTVEVSDPIDPNAPRTLSVRTFGEAAINLTDSGIFDPNSCEGFGSGYLKSRSSDSFTSAVKDFIAPLPINITNCGHIVIDKVTVPSGDTQSFAFTLTGGPSNLNQSFNLTDAATPHDSGFVVAGSGYNAAETVPTGWDLTNTSCDDGSPVTNIDVSVGETVTCTFTNTKRGTIIVEKQTDPDGASGSFTFTGDAAGSIGDGGQITVSNLVPGTYSSTEANPAPAFDLTSIVCNDGSSPTPSTGNVGTRTATFNLDAGETVKCTFTNRARGTITVHKDDDAGAALQGAVFTLFTDNTPFGGSRGQEDTSTGMTCQTNASGNCSFSNLLPGQYWVVETTTPAGHDTAADQHVTLGAGATVPLTFVDPRKFTVIVLVCRESDNSLYSSTVTVDGANTSSLGTAANESTLCALGGARYTGKHTGNHPANVNIPTNELP